MTTAMQLTSLVMAAAVTLFVPASPPRCIEDLIRSESGARAEAPAPSVEPTRGHVGTSMRIRGAGAEPGARLTIAAVYAEKGCVIEGLGDQYLVSTVADATGAYSVRVRWPSMFDPVLGRNKSAAIALPRGRYYVFRCRARRARPARSLRGRNPAGRSSSVMRGHPRRRRSRVAP